MLTGEKPEVNAERAPSGCTTYGLEDFTAYVVWACERALERGLLPHTNLGVLDREDLARLREVTASQGLMLESISERLMETVHAGSPTKHPARRIETIARRRRAEDPVHERDPGRDRRDRGGADRARSRRSRGSARAPRSPAGGDPPELRPAPELLRPRAGGDRGRRGARVLAHRGRERAAARRAGVGLPVTIEDMKRLIAEARRLMPEIGIQVPPNLSRLVARARRAPAPPTSAG